MRMEPEQQPPLFERVIGGVGRSAINGAVMMGLYIPLQLLAAHLGLSTMMAGLLGVAVTSPVAALAAGALVVITAVSIFGGIVASGILGHQHGKSAHAPSREPTTEMERELQQTQELDGPGPVIIPVPMLADKAQAATAASESTNHFYTQAPQKRWTERADINPEQNRNRIAKILADGTSDRSHAEAIIAAQQESSATPTIH